MGNLITITNVLGSFATNCYTVANSETREAIIIDPATKADFLINMYNNQNLLYFYTYNKFWDLYLIRHTC